MTNVADTMLIRAVAATALSVASLLGGCIGPQVYESPVLIAEHLSEEPDGGVIDWSVVDESESFYGIVTAVMDNASSIGKGSAKEPIANGEGLEIILWLLDEWNSQYGAENSEPPEGFHVRHKGLFFYVFYLE